MAYSPRHSHVVTNQVQQHQLVNFVLTKGFECSTKKLSLPEVKPKCQFSCRIYQGPKLFKPSVARVGQIYFQETLLINKMSLLSIKSKGIYGYATLYFRKEYNAMLTTQNMPFVNGVLLF